MAHTVHGLLRKPPFIKQLESSTMFIVELSEMIKDYQTQEKTYTNYKAMLFAKSDAAIAYYNKAFAEGSFVVVSCEKLKVDKFDADNGTTYITLMMDNARLEGAKFDDVNDGNWGQPQQPSQQPAHQQNFAPQQQAPQQQQPVLDQHGGYTGQDGNYYIGGYLISETDKRHPKCIPF